MGLFDFLFGTHKRQESAKSNAKAHSYKDACEEDDPSNVSYGYLNDLFSEEVAADTAEVDTTVVD